MEEPPFIKCEPNWLPEPDTATFSDFDSEVQLPSINPDEAKVETHHVLDNPCGEEESANVVKEEFEMQNTQSETLHEKGEISGVLVNNDKNSSLCTRLEKPADDVESSPCGEKNNLVHVCTEECKNPVPKLTKPVHCKTCNKLISHPRNLNRHMKTHKQEPLYGCTKCGKMFSLRAYLNMHMFVHSQERPHTCSTCGKSFRRKHNLKNHLSVHSSNDCAKT